MYSEHKKYRKLRSSDFIERNKDIKWKVILSKTENKDEIKKARILLMHFNGCFIKADGIICILNGVNDNSWCRVVLDDGSVQWFALGSYFDIWLPLK